MASFVSYLEMWLRYKAKTVEGTKYTVTNPLAILRQNGRIKLTNGQTFVFNKNNKKDILTVVSFLLDNGVIAEGERGQWKVDTEKGIIETTEGIKFNLEKFNPTIMAETYLYDIHYTEGLENNVVIQAGGFTGDTALYYASKGARVYSFEPDINSYNLALSNIRLNPSLSQQIVFENLAIGDDGVVEFPLNEGGSGSSSIYDSQAARRTKVKALSLTTILNEYNIESPYLLDLDIKGAEFTVIRDKALRKFDKIRIEYAPYLLKDSEATLAFLEEKLQDYGFDDFRIFKFNCCRFDLLNCGVLQASKKTNS